MLTHNYLKYKFIGVVGSRRRDLNSDFKQVETEFFKIYRKNEYWIVSGGCKKGADKFAEKIANQHGIPILIFPADWTTYGNGAGLVRNTDIANVSDILIARVTPDRKGGTEDTVKKFLSRPDYTCLVLIHDERVELIQSRIKTF